MRALLVLASMLGFGGVAVAGPTRADAPAPAITAILTYETRDLDREGVTHTSTYQERFVRDGDHVWIERVYPAGVTPTRAPSPHDLDLRVAVRSFTHTTGDAVALQLISVPDRTILDIPADSFDGVGISHRWTIAAFLVDLSTMTPTATKAPTGARWYQSADRGLQVLWSASLALPLQIVSTRDDGRAITRVTVTPTATTPAHPWATLVGYERKDLSDLGD